MWSLHQILEDQTYVSKYRSSVAAEISGVQAAWEVGTTKLRASGHLRSCAAG